MMDDLRLCAIEALRSEGLLCPERYVSMLEDSEVNMGIENLMPWMFLSDSRPATEYCSKMLGRTVIGFAQAVGEDMMACFAARGGSTPGVIVMNPWCRDPERVVIADLEDFDAWLEYAERVSVEWLANQDDKDDDQ